MGHPKAGQVRQQHCCVSPGRIWELTTWRHYRQLGMGLGCCTFLLSHPQGREPRAQGFPRAGSYCWTSCGATCDRQGGNHREPVGQIGVSCGWPKAQLAKRNPDDALNRAAESLRQVLHELFDVRAGTVLYVYIYIYTCIYIYIMCALFMSKTYTPERNGSNLFKRQIDYYIIVFTRHMVQ